MCGFCGSFERRHWTAAPVHGARPSLARLHVADVAARVAAAGGVRLKVWGDRFQLTGRTGRTALALDLAEVWRAADRLGRPVDPLDEALLAGLEGKQDPHPDPLPRAGEGVLGPVPLSGGRDA